MNTQVSPQTGTAGSSLRGQGYEAYILPGVPEAVSTARTLTRRFTGGSGQADNAVTCVSELATNAIVHTRSGLPGGHFAVTLERQPDGSVVISVVDEGARSGSPVLPWGEHGRGLAMVEILSAGWGIVPMYGSGRLTWVRIGPLAPHGRDADRDGGETPRRDTSETPDRDTSRDAALAGIRP
jgi:serine/threonine-protein kinase RsbW